MHGVPGENTQNIDCKDTTGLSEEHELGKLPANDEQGRGQGDGQDVFPTRPFKRKRLEISSFQSSEILPYVSSSNADCQNLRQTDWKSKTFPQRWCPHNTCTLAMVVKKAENWHQTTKYRAR